jgi:hypothetical protein
MISKFSVAEVVPNSGYSTGPLHVIYSDGACDPRAAPVEEEQKNEIEDYLRHQVCSGALSLAEAKDESPPIGIRCTKEFTG